jgi:hypothetical protein
MVAAGGRPVGVHGAPLLLLLLLQTAADSAAQTEHHVEHRAQRAAVIAPRLRFATFGYDGVRGVAPHKNLSPRPRQ